MDAYENEIPTVRGASSERVYGEWSLGRPGPEDFVPREIYFAPPPRERLVGELIAELHARLLPTGEARVLDVVAGPESFLDRVPGARVVGVVPTEDRARSNPALTSLVVRDLDVEPTLSFADETFDAAVLSLDVGVLARPLEVFREVGRVLREEGVFVVSFAPSFFTPDLTRMWALGDDFDHVTLAESFFSFSEAFTRETSLALARRTGGVRWYSTGAVPEDDPRGVVYAVYAYKERVAARHRIAPPFPAPPVPVDRPRAIVLGGDGRPSCPYCASPMLRIAPPVTPFEIDYGVAELHVCFNDRCDYHRRSKQWMRRQGRPNTTYRFMRNPETGATGPILDNLFSGLATSRIE